MSDDEAELVTAPVTESSVAKEVYARAVTSLNALKSLGSAASTLRVSEVVEVPPGVDSVESLKTQAEEWSMKVKDWRVKAPPTVQQLERADLKDQEEAADRARKAIAIAKVSTSMSL